MAEFIEKQKLSCFNESYVKSFDLSNIKLNEIKLPKLVSTDRFENKHKDEKTYQNSVNHDRLRLRNSFLNNERSMSIEFSLAHNSLVTARNNTKSYFSIKEEPCLYASLNDSKKKTKYMDLNTFYVNVSIIYKSVHLKIQLFRESAICI